MLEKLEYGVGRERHEAILVEYVQVEELHDVVVDEADHGRMQRLHALLNLLEEPAIQVEVALVHERVGLEPLVEEVNAERGGRCGQRGRGRSATGGHLSVQSGRDGQRAHVLVEEHVVGKDLLEDARQVERVALELEPVADQIRGEVSEQLELIIHLNKIIN